MSLLVRCATLSDCPALLALHAKWQKQSRAGKFEDGFVDSFLNLEITRDLVTRQDVVVACDGNTVIGYYLLNAARNAPTSLGKTQALQAAGRLPKACRVGLGAQAALEKPYRGRQLREKMLALLAQQTFRRYDLFLSTIDKLNRPAFVAHTQKDGWEFIGEDDEVYYVVLYPLRFLVTFLGR